MSFAFLCKNLATHQNTPETDFNCVYNKNDDSFHFIYISDCMDELHLGSHRYKLKRHLGGGLVQLVEVLFVWMVLGGLIPP